MPLVYHRVILDAQGAHPVGLAMLVEFGRCIIKTAGNVQHQWKFQEGQNDVFYLGLDFYAFEKKMEIFAGETAPENLGRYHRFVESRHVLEVQI